MKKEDIDSVNQFIRLGDFSKVEFLLAKIRKKKLSLRDKVSISDYYDRIGNFEEGFQMLGGKNQKLEAKKIADDEDAPEALIYYSCLAQKLSNKGSKYSAFNILNIVNEMLPKVQLKKEDYLRILLYKINIYYAYYYYQHAEKALDEYLRINPSNPSRENFKIHFLRAFVQAELGCYENAILQLETLLSQKLESYHEALCLIDLGTIYAKLDMYEKAEKILLKALSLLDKGPSTIDKVYCLKWLSYLDFKNSRNDEARSKLLQAKKILDSMGHFPLAKLEILHFLEQVDKQTLTNEEHVSLYTYFEFHPYKFVDRSHHGTLSRKVFPAWPKLVNQKKPHNSFYYFKGKLELISYSSFPKTPKVPLIDLKCQLIQDGQNIRIPMLKAKTIYALVSSIGVGISKWALADYVYAEKFVNFELSMIKLNKLVKSVSEYFEDIQLIDGIYYCKASAHFSYILPVFKEDCHIKNLVGRIFTNVPKQRDLQEFFTISSPTAYRLRQEIIKR
jgi:tetratricopeptide (TPR) repeat protein